MTTLTNTGNHLMTAAFYNEMRRLETEDVRDDDTLRLVSIAVSEVAQAPRREAEKTPPTMDFDNDEGSMEDVAGLVLGVA